MTIADVPEASAERKRKQDSGDAETQEAERRAKERKDGTEERRVGQTDVQAKEKESAKLSENATVPAKERKATQKDKPYEYICPHYERDRDNAEAQEAERTAKKRKDGTDSPRERRTDVQAEEKKGTKSSKKAVVHAKTGEAQKEKSFQYVCPSCKEAVTSSICTGQIDHRRTCGNYFQVKDGCVVTKLYTYVCPACTGSPGS